MSFVPAQFTSFTSNLHFDALSEGSGSSVRSRLQQLRRPADFFDFSRMRKPANVLDLQSRLSFNLGYFASNYMLIVGGISLYLILTNFPLLVLILLDGTSFYLIQRFFGNSDELDLHFFVLHKNVVYTTILLVNLPVLFMSSPITTLMWLVLSSAAIVLTHAAFMDKPVEASYSDAV